MKTTSLIKSLLQFGFLLLLPVGIQAQQIVKEYKIQNLISGGILQKFQQINEEVKVYDHLEGNRLILVGDSLKIEDAIEQLEMLDTKQMMVTIEFMLVEYFHNHDFEWGIDITQGKSGNFNNTSFTPSASASTASFLYNSVTKLAPSFQFNIRALVNDDKAKVLTNPHLVVESGKEANLTIKDRRTIVLETATINGVTTSLQNIEAGIDIRIIPVPTHDSLIHLNINGQISEFLPFSSAGEFLVEDNSIKTEVDVRNGHTLILGGLIMEQTNTVNGGVPLLKDIPVLGQLFKSKREIKSYVERVMYITPYLHPVDDLNRYEQIRQMTPLESKVEEVIEQDPEFLKYNKSKKSIRRNRKAARKNRTNN
ncbi:MAG: type II and III secretion system protein [Saprospiraceae bacterium]|nr:type II and III secretion system protein [Saprospiraceae bacterium]